MINKLNFSNILYIFILLINDFFILIFSLKVALYFRINYLETILPYFDKNEISQYYWIILLTLLFLFFEKIYFVRYDFWSDTKRIIKSLFFSFITVFTVITLTKMSMDYSRMFIVLFYVISIFLLPTSKRILKRLLFKFDLFKLKVKVSGQSLLVDKMITEVNKNWYFGFYTVKKDYDTVIILSKNISVEQLQRMIRRYSKKTKDIYVVPYMYHLDFTHTTIVDYFNIRLSAIHIENRLLNYKNIFIKYFFEKIMVISIFPLALILHFFISLFIKMDSRGSIFFKQKRFGQKGNAFSCYKYRTMYVDGDEILKKYLDENPDEIEYYNTYHKYKKDPRITKIGKFLRATSLDEFPQFFNILRGDMNLIGPRPYMLNEKEKIGKSNEEVILEVKPGITGLWQVSGRNNLTFNERVDLDKWYIQNWSLWMDFVIFIKTIKVVLSKVGAK